MQIIFSKTFCLLLQLKKKRAISILQDLRPLESSNMKHQCTWILQCVKRNMLAEGLEGQHFELQFQSLWGQGSDSQICDILAFSIQHGNSEIQPRRNAGKIYMSQLLILMRVNLQGCQELDDPFAKSLFHRCTFLSSYSAQ